MSDISANFQLDIGNGCARIELGRDYNRNYDEPPNVFSISLSCGDKDCEIKKIEVHEMKRFIKQLNTLVDLYETE